MKAHAIRSFRTLHTWSGALAGLILFLVFCAGSLTLFAPQLTQWSRPVESSWDLESLPDTQRLAERLHSTHPELKGEFSLALPTEEQPRTMAYWLAPGTDRWVFATGEDLELSQPSAHQGLGEFLNELHHNLGLGRGGSLFLGILCLLYALALLSGLWIHLPKAGRMLSVNGKAGLRRLWGDIHGVLGLLGLPFHIVIALSGALFALFMVLVMSFDGPVFQGRLSPHLDSLLGTADPVSPGSGPAAPLALEGLVTLAREAVPGFEPEHLRFHRFGLENGTVQILGRRRGHLGSFGSLVMEARSGRILELQVPGQRGGNQALLSALYGLHFGDFGGRPVRIAYFLLGLSGALLILSGQIAWVEARWKNPATRRWARLMARLSVGFCGGSLLGLVACFPVATFAPGSIPWAFWGSLALGLAWAFLGSLRLCIPGLLLAMGLLCLSIPCLDAHPSASLAVDLSALAFGALFFALGNLLRTRLQHAWA